MGDDGGIHIAIAEGNAITRRMIELAITYLGRTFDPAANGAEALSIVERTACECGHAQDDRHSGSLPESRFN
jgi:hypothetical protein